MIEVKIIEGITPQTLTAEDYLLSMKGRYEFHQMTNETFNRLQNDLDLFHHIYGKKLKYILNKDTIMITDARPKIIFLGEELPNDKEHELVNGSEKGFDVKIVYTKNSVWLQKEETVHNVTEVHYLFSSPIKEQVAFESDIHFTGFTRPVEDIELIEIVEAIDAVK